MIHRILRPLVFLLTLLLFMGSAGWMYTGHFCKMEVSCEEINEDDCCNQLPIEKETSAETADGLFLSAPAAGETCCFDVNFYINFPLYRTTVVEIPDVTIVNGSLIAHTFFHADNFFIPSLASPLQSDPMGLKGTIALSQRLAELKVFRV